MADDTPKSSSSATTMTNPRGIPHFPFLPHATDYVQSADPADVGRKLEQFQEMIQKYTFMRENVEKRLLGLKEKVPEIRSSLDTVRFLIRKRRSSKKDATTPERSESSPSLSDSDSDSQTTLPTIFPLADTLHAHATITPAAIDDVCLWLGANVMVAYPLAEAQALLESKLAKARESITGCEEDIEYLRVQITTLEVATARVYNWDIGEKRKRAAEEGSGSGAGGKAVT